MRSIIIGATAGLLAAVLVGMYVIFDDTAGTTIVPFALAFAIAGAIVGWVSKHVSSRIGGVLVGALAGVVTFAVMTFRTGFGGQTVILGAVMGLIIGLAAALLGRSSG